MQMKKNRYSSSTLMPALILTALAMSACTTIQTLALKEGVSSIVSAFPSGPSVILFPVTETFEGRPEATKQKSDQTLLGKTLEAFGAIGPIPYLIAFDEFHSDASRTESVRAGVLSRLKERGIPTDYLAEGGAERLRAYPQAVIGLSVRVRRLEVKHEMDFLLPTPITFSIMRDKIISQIALECTVWRPGQTTPLAKVTTQGSNEGGNLMHDIASVVDKCIDKTGLVELRAQLAASTYAQLMKEGQDRESIGAATEAWKLYAQAYRYALKDEEALAAIEALVHVDRGAPAKPVSQQAENLMRQGKAAESMAKNPEAFSAAAQYMDKALALAPWWAQGHENLAAALEDAGLGAHASRHLKLYLALEPAAANREEVLMKIASLSMRKPGTPSEAPERVQRKQEESAAMATAEAIHSDVDTPSFRLPVRPDDWALVVGIETYQKKLPKADFAERDAAAVREHLIALGVPEQNVILLSGPDATQSVLKSYLKEYLPKNVTPHSRVFFFFSGHGAPDPDTGQAYLVPWEAEPQFIKTQGFPLQELYHDLAQLKAGQVLIAMDSCFSGAGGRSVLQKGARPLVNVKSEASAVAPNMAVLAATQSDQITGSLDKQGHGLFTYYLLSGLNASKRDVQSLYDFIKPNVEKMARRQNNIQVPVFEGFNLEL
jgi:hypothetical protein